MVVAQLRRGARQRDGRLDRNGSPALARLGEYLVDDDDAQRGRKEEDKEERK